MEKIESFDKKPGDTSAEKKEKKMKIVCAWCNKELGFKEGGEGVTHSICEECKKKELEKLRQFKEEEK